MTYTQQDLDGLSQELLRIWTDEVYPMAGDVPVMVAILDPQKPGMDGSAWMFFQGDDPVDGMQRLAQAARDRPPPSAPYAICSINTGYMEQVHTLEEVETRGSLADNPGPDTYHVVIACAVTADLTATTLQVCDLTPDKVVLQGEPETSSGSEGRVPDALHAVFDAATNVG